MGDLHRRLGGRPIDDFGEAVAWLNHFWCSPWNRLRVGPGYRALALAAEDYPALVMVSPKDSGGTKPFFGVVLAAWFDGYSEGGAKPPRSAQTRRLVEELQGYSEGLSVSLQPGGLLLEGQATSVRALAGKGDLEALLLSLAALAQAYGGCPAPPD